MEGSKQLLIMIKERQDKNEPKATKGHYKIGQPIFNNVRYTPKLVSTYNKTVLRHGMDQSLTKNLLQLERY